MSINIFIIFFPIAILALSAQILNRLTFAKGNIKLLKASAHNTYLKFIKTVHKGVEYITRWSGQATNTIGDCPKPVTIWSQADIGQVVETPTAQYV